MKKELPYFKIEEARGGNQEWFPDRMMRLGGCAVVTACDSCIFFDLYKETHLYPFDRKNITKADYIRFGMEMKPYLRPRWSGIDTLDIYMEGFGKYEKRQEKFMAKIVTYGKYFWVDFQELWNTGHKRKGGLILYHGKEG